MHWDVIGCERPNVGGAGTYMSDDLVDIVVVGPTHFFLEIYWESLETVHFLELRDLGRS